MRNPVTGKFEMKKVFNGYDFEVVGVGDTKEEAKADLKKKLEPYRIPGSDRPGYRGPKYRPKMKVVGYINSPGYVAEMDENGKVSYTYKEDRQAQVFALDRSSQNLAESAKVDSEGK